MPSIKSFVSLLIALSIIPACGSSDCEKVYEAAAKCTEGKEKERLEKIGKSEVVSMCEKMKSDPEMKAEIEAELACAKEDSCEKMKACQKAQSGKRRAKEITDQIAAGKWKEAFDDCTLMEDDYANETYKAECNKVFANVDKIAEPNMYRCKSGEKIKKVAPEFEKACKALATKQLAAAQKKATEARDGGKNDFAACSELKEVAEQAGGDAPAAAAKLCEEMGAAEDAKKGAEQARANAAAKKTDTPYQCDSAAEKLAKLDTEWAKKTLEDLYKACYLELGAVVLEEKSKDVKYVCPYQITSLVEAIQKRDLAAKFPEVAEMLKKLPAKCQDKDKDKKAK